MDLLYLSVVGVITSHSGCGRKDDVLFVCHSSDYGVCTNRNAIKQCDFQKNFGAFV